MWEIVQNNLKECMAPLLGECWEKLENGENTIIFLFLGSKEGFLAIGRTQNI